MSLHRVGRDPAIGLVRDFTVLARVAPVHDGTEHVLVTLGSVDLDLGVGDRPRLAGGWLAWEGPDADGTTVVKVQRVQPPRPPVVLGPGSRPHLAERTDGVQVVWETPAGGLAWTRVGSDGAAPAKVLTPGPHDRRPEVVLHNAVPRVVFDRLVPRPARLGTDYDVLLHDGSREEAVDNRVGIQAGASAVSADGLWVAYHDNYGLPSTRWWSVRQLSDGVQTRFAMDATRPNPWDSAWFAARPALVALDGGGFAVVTRTESGHAVQTFDSRGVGVPVVVGPGPRRPTALFHGKTRSVWVMGVDNADARGVGDLVLHVVEVPTGGPPAMRPGRLRQGSLPSPTVPPSALEGVELTRFPPLDDPTEPDEVLALAGIVPVATLRRAGTLLLYTLRSANDEPLDATIEIVHDGTAVYREVQSGSQSYGGSWGVSEPGRYELVAHTDGAAGPVVARSPVVVID